MRKSQTLLPLVFALGIGCASNPRASENSFGSAGPSPEPKGTLFIVGGGSQSEDLVKAFVQLAGGPGRARIAILPMATSDAVETGAEKEAQLDSLGADSFVVNVSRTQADAGRGRRHHGPG